MYYNIKCSLRGYVAFIVESDHTIHIDVSHRAILKNVEYSNVTCGGYVQIEGIGHIKVHNWNGTSGVQAPSGRFKHLIVKEVEQRIIDEEVNHD